MPVEETGAFDVRVESNRLIVQAADGRVLLDGLPPGSVLGEAPPTVGFATRDVTTTYESEFGAFKPTATPNGSWQVANTLSVEGGTVSLKSGSSALATLKFSSAETGHLVVDITGPDAVDEATPERATKLSWGFACEPTDHFAGFGAQTWDADHRGQTVPTLVTEGGIGKSTTDEYIGLWQLQGQRHSSHAPIPQYLARRGYILTVESDRRSVFALCSEKETAARVEIDMPARIHLFDGPTPSEAIARATATFGRPRVPPRVSFAPWLDAVFGSENVRRVAQKLRDEEIPVSVIWTEDWRGGEYSGGDTYALKEEWEVDRELYPDIEEVADELHTLGYHFHVYFNPFIYEDTKAWEETADQGWLIKNKDGENYTFTGAKLTTTSMIDLDNPDAREWAVGKMRAAMELGADGWMHDFAEWLPMDAVTAAGPAYERHNVYPVRWQEIAREAIDGAPDGQERLFFARSAWFGSPELVDVFWAGDQQTSFTPDDGIPTIIPQAIGLGVVGISSYGHDIAGYQSGIGDGSSKELFLRWTSLGAWSPVMRTHHGAQPLKQWSWEKDAETTEHFRASAALHMALVPLMASLAKQASETGLPIWRGLAIAFPEDEAVWSITDQIMLGDGIMIAPVLTEGAKSREVYLPEGVWYPWTVGDSFTGPTSIEVDASMTEIPVFARAGTIVPMYPDGVMTLVNASTDVPGPEQLGDARVVRVFPGASSELVEDNGTIYSLTSEGELGPAASVRYEGDALADCAAVEEGEACFQTSGDTTIARVPSAGKVVVTDGAGNALELEIDGSDVAYEIRVR